MPPKQRITKEMVLNSAYTLLSREGMEEVSARTLAKELNSSTQPIFSYYTNMGELREDLVKRAHQEFQKELEPHLGAKHGIVATCKGYVRFARRQPHSYKLLFLNQDFTPEGLPTEGDKFQGFVKQEMELGGLSREQAEQVCYDLAIYTLGLASLITMGKNIYKDSDPDELIDRAYDAAMKEVKGK